MAKFINPFTDFGFKRIFGQEDTKPLLMGFLNALFESEFVITELTYLDKEQLGTTQEERSVIYDIYCKTADGKQFIIEMQNKNQFEFESRALYYMARSIVAQGEKGDDWLYQYCPVVGVFLMNFKHDSLGKAWRSDFAIRRIKTDPVVEEPKAPQQLTEKIRMVFLQLPLFNKTEEQCTTNLDKWTYIIKNMNTLKEIPWKQQDELFEELSRVSNVASLSPEERAIYERNLKNYRDNNAVRKAAYDDGHEAGREAGLIEGREAGLIEGRESGFFEGQKKIALSLIQQGFSDDMISTTTGLSFDDLAKIRSSSY